MCCMTDDLRFYPGVINGNFWHVLMANLSIYVHELYICGCIWLVHVLCYTNLYFFLFSFYPYLTITWCARLWIVTPWCLHLVVEIGRKKQFSQNVSEYHPPIGVWIACRARLPLLHHIATPPLRIQSTLSIHLSLGQTASAERLEWTWNSTVAVEIAMILMTSAVVLLPKLCPNCK